MVRSFLGRFVRIGTEPRIDVDREVKARQNTSLHTGEGRQMILSPKPLADDRQGQPLKAFEQAFSRGAGRRPCWVPDIQPRPCRPCGGQALADHKLQQCEDPQAHRQPSDQADGVVVPLQLQRG
jgi:hypothetical protein